MSLAREIGEFLMATRLSRYFKIRRDGYVMRFHPTNISLRLWQNSLRGRYAYGDDEKFIRSLLRPGEVVFDVGANVGMVTLAAGAAVGEQGAVYSFEPHPEVCSYLKSNAEMNGFGQVKVFNLALGDKPGKVYFTNMKQDDRNRINCDGEGVEVEVKTLDEVSEGVDEISLLKVDVEGYEKFVFKGAAETLRKSRVVYYECYEKNFNNFGYSGGEVHEIVRSAGFELFTLEDGKLTGLTMGTGGDKVENIVAIKDRTEFLSRTGISIE